MPVWAVALLCLLSFSSSSQWNWGREGQDSASSHGPLELRALVGAAGKQSCPEKMFPYGMYLLQRGCVVCRVGWGVFLLEGKEVWEHFWDTGLWNVFQCFCFLWEQHCSPGLFLPPLQQWQVHTAYILENVSVFPLLICRKKKNQ